MRQRADTLKLAELRSKTDRQILALVSHRLDAALQHADETGDLSNVEAAYEDATRWISLAPSLTAAELRPVQRQLRRLFALWPRKVRAFCA
jgi:hypothetical protein